MVTVYLRAGCNQKSSRRYVLLADFPSETALPAVASAVTPAVAPSAPLPAAAPGQSAAVESSANPATPARSNGADVAPASAAPTAQLTTPSKARPVPRPKPPKALADSTVKPIPKDKAKDNAKAKVPAAAAAAPTVAAPTVATPSVATPPTIAPATQAVEKAPNPAQTSAAVGQSRLKLDPLIVLTERVANLESSSSAPASDGMRDAQRMQSLEESVKTLVALAAKNEASLQDMRKQVQAAQADRVPAQWLYGLVALVLACLAAMAYMWSRLSAMHATQGPGAKDDWWRGARNALPAAGTAATATVDAQAVPDALQAVPDAKERVVSKPVALQGAGVESRYSSLTGLEDDPSSELDVSLVEMTESNFDQLMKSGKSHSAIRPGPLAPQVEPMPATTKMQALAARPINSEQLFDVRQQADFFVSLGQTDQAVQILEKQINDHGETSPLIYLDLLQIFHSLNLKTDFRQFREDFNLLFNARVPEFAAFRNEGKSLEEYPHVLAHITALWSTRKALMVIEASIFRDSLDDRSTPFDLAAFRDLLLLHAIAQSFTIREEPTSDLTPLRANMAPISKGARLSALSGSAAGSFDANSTVDVALPPLSGLAEVDISLNSSGVGLLPASGLPNLPSVTGVLNAPTTLDPINAGFSAASASAPSSGSGGLDLELDLDLSGLVALSPAHSAAQSATQKPDGSEVSDFSKLLKAQAPAAAGTQGFKAKSAATESGNSGSGSQAGYLADNLLDFDLSSESAKLTVANPKGNKAKPK
jgi:pilus assembly protein FimV